LEIEEKLGHAHSGANFGIAMKRAEFSSGTLYCLISMQLKEYSANSFGGHVKVRLAQWQLQMFGHGRDFSDFNIA